MAIVERDVFEKTIKLYEELLAAYKENRNLLTIKISGLEEELAKRDLPESIALLRDQMHHYRRQCDELSTKLKEAEAYIEQITELIAERNHKISELLQRCKELENPSHIKNIDNT